MDEGCSEFVQTRLPLYETEREPVGSTDNFQYDANSTKAESTMLLLECLRSSTRATVLTLNILVVKLTAFLLCRQTVLN